MARSRWNARKNARRLLAAETGTATKDAPRQVALVYPSPYRAAMSSLGYQSIYRALNALPGVAADRAVLPDRVDDDEPLLTLERECPVTDYSVIGFSVAYELEIAGVIRCLELAGLPALAAERGPDAPLVIAGGPLTFSNPAPLGPFVDVVVLGEAEETLLELLAVADEHGDRRQAVAAALVGRPGFFVPVHDGDTVPPIAAAPDSLLPARSQILTPNTELRSMFLTEVARGCSRGCGYCVMRRSTNRGMRVVPAEEVLAGIPDHARRVGLVGAAVTDHPRIRQIIRTIVDDGRQVGISSLRADRLDGELVGLLVRGGYRTLTVAADGASQRLRDAVERRITERHLLAAAELARAHRLQTLKLYVMVGLPGETDADLDELVLLVRELVRIQPRVALGVAPFVAKRRTPLCAAPYAGTRVLSARLDRLRTGLAGAAQVRPTSARWAWVEYALAQGGAEAGLAVLDAVRSGATFRAYRRAFEARTQMTPE